MHPRLISCVELVARVAHLLVAWPLAAKISFESDDIGKLHESYTSEDEYIFYFEKIDRISGRRGTHGSAAAWADGPARAWVGGGPPRAAWR